MKAPTKLKPEILHVANPVPPGQLHVTPVGLATMFSRKKSWVHQMVAEARKAKQRGQDPAAICPPFRVINKCLYFKVSDVLAWAEREPLYGTAQYGGDHPANRRAERERAAAEKAGTQ